MQSTPINLALYDSKIGSRNFYNNGHWSTQNEWFTSCQISTKPRDSENNDDSDTLRQWQKNPFFGDVSYRKTDWQIFSSSSFVLVQPFSYFSSFSSLSRRFFCARFEPETFSGLFSVRPFNFRSETSARRNFFRPDRRRVRRIRLRHKGPKIRSRFYLNNKKLWRAWGGLGRAGLRECGSNCSIWRDDIDEKFSNKRRFHHILSPPSRASRSRTRLERRSATARTWLSWVRPPAVCIAAGSLPEIWKKRVSKKFLIFGIGILLMVSSWKKIWVIWQAMVRWT